MTMTRATSLETTRAASTSVVLTTALEPSWVAGVLNVRTIVCTMLRGAAGNPGERFGAQVQIQGAAVSGSPRNPWVSWGGEHRSERIRHTRSEERRSLLGGPRLRGMARGRWAASGVPTKPASWGG